ncbi:hypothetical protein RhiirC2_410705 [Rhizophagus irregularis]|uniref:Uncharacterized protein n=1 Tax=Rhizophagus irregularis TaxID=588596 RepID=A0A2N1NZH4_9GLOM|nr:hypothetical protein RhiirC2_410705 [Rhizophagus irregularis]
MPSLTKSFAFYAHMSRFFIEKMSLVMLLIIRSLNISPTTFWKIRHAHGYLSGTINNGGSFLYDLVKAVGNLFQLYFNSLNCRSCSCSEQLLARIKKLIFYFILTVIIVTLFILKN